MKLGINENISNKEYHDDREFLSSSALKLLHKDPQAFYKRYMLGEREEVSNQAALDFGTAAHLMLLEPHLYDTDVVVFPGAVRRGKEFDKFKAENEGKLILTNADYMKLTELHNAFIHHPAGPPLLDSCLFEHTMCGILEDMKFKVRADAISIDGGYIVDVKTTAYAGGIEAFRSTLESLYYDLSAALYCEIAKQIYNKPFDFYYIVLSKNDLSCNIYKTSKSTFSIGYERMYEAIKIYKKCLLTNVWEHEILISEVNEDIQEI